MTTVDTDKINEQIAKLHSELIDLRIQQTKNEVKDTSVFKKKRREIARLRTQLNAKGTQNG